MQAVESIPRRSLHDELVERLRGLLLEGQLEPGDKVPERELCERLDVSRTPMREALKVLAADGLITLIPNRGAVVKRLSRAELADLFQVMGALEALSGELACKHITDAEIDRIERTHRKMVGHYRKGNLPGYFQCNRRIHELILEASRNHVLAAQYRSLSMRMQRPRYLANLSTGRWSEAVSEHAAILEALRARDGGRLSRLLTSHLEKKFQAVMAQIDEQTSP